MTYYKHLKTSVKERMQLIISTSLAIKSKFLAFVMAIVSFFKLMICLFEDDKFHDMSYADINTLPISLNT